MKVGKLMFVVVVVVVVVGGREKKIEKYAKRRFWRTVKATKVQKV